MLTHEDIQSLALAAGLSIREEDLDDLSIGLNALLDALGELPEDILQGIEPISVLQGDPND